MDPRGFEPPTSGPKPDVLSKLDYGSLIKDAQGETRTHDLLVAVSSETKFNSQLLYLLSYLGMSILFN